MRRLILALPLFAAACTAPRPPVVEAAKPVVTVAPERGELIGLSADDLAQRFGRPDMTFREGAGTKLQYRSARCVLDVYLYQSESGQGVARVAHVDARDREGRDTDSVGCESDILAAR
jgi:hypothetical protein